MGCDCYRCSQVGVGGWWCRTPRDAALIGPGRRTSGAGGGVRVQRGGGGGARYRQRNPRSFLSTDKFLYNRQLRPTTIKSFLSMLIKLATNNMIAFNGRLVDHSVGTDTAKIVAKKCLRICERSKGYVVRLGLYSDEFLSHNSNFIVRVTNHWVPGLYEKIGVHNLTWLHFPQC